MTIEQPPFVICTPIACGANWPGLVVGEIEAMLDGLGNPAGDAMMKALDATGVVHFISLSVVWNQEAGERPFLAADLSADGTTDSIIAALITHAGALLLPVYERAVGVASLTELRSTLEAGVLKPVEQSLPVWPHWATGVPFQGTPGLTVARIKRDAAMADKARVAVFSTAAGGPSSPLASLRTARMAAKIPAGSRRPGPPTILPPQTDPTLRDQALKVLRQVFLDLYYVFFFLFFVFMLNYLDISRSTEKIQFQISIWLATLLLILLISSLFFRIWLESGRRSAPGSAQLRRARGADWLPPLGLALVLAFVIQWPKPITTWIKAALTSVLERVSVVLNPPVALVSAVINPPMESVGALFKSPTAWIVGKLVPFLGWIEGWPFTRWLISHIWPPQNLIVLWVAGALAILSLILFVIAVVGLFAAVLRAHEAGQKPRDLDPEPEKIAELMRREDIYPQNHMIGVATVKPGFFRRYVALPFGLYAAGLLVKSGIFQRGFLSRVGTIHAAQWIVLPGTRTLVFAASYDGSWQSYLEDFITLSPQGASAIWSNCADFPETNWLFLDGAADGDRFKRWVRRQTIPTRFWYSAYPNLSATQIRANAEVRRVLEAGDGVTLSEAEAWLKLFGSVPRPAGELELDQIQGLALVAYRNLYEGVVLGVIFPPDNAPACKAWLAGVNGRIDFGDAGSDDSAMAVALTARGIERMGVDKLASRFSTPFALGMASEARGHVLGDTGKNAPGKWDWGHGPTAVDAVLILYAIDQLTLGPREVAEAAWIDRCGLTPCHKVRLHQLPLEGAPITEPFGFVDGISQPSIKGLTSSLDAIDIDLVEPGEFILGYPDGRGQFPPTPQVLGIADRQQRLPDLPTGYPPPPDVIEAKPGHKPAIRDFGRNGSYLVIRQLEQDVAGYQAYVAGQASVLGRPADWVAAKMVGRWPNGAPLVLFPNGAPTHYDVLSKDETFLFGRDDPQGLACPFGAHIRRANPRDQFDAGDKVQMSITNRHRILRRGRSYVDGDNSGSDAQGLVFMCLNADIERQFEFLQQTWLGGRAFAGLSNEIDPIAATKSAGGTFTIPTTVGPLQLVGMPAFVTVKGGGYFFLPGRQALEWLAN